MKKWYIDTMECYAATSKVMSGNFSSLEWIGLYQAEPNEQQAAEIEDNLIHLLHIEKQTRK